MHCLKIALIVLFLTTDVEDMKSLNVGTALFLKSDLLKECWEKDNVALLQFRRLMQHIIPNKLVDANDDKYIQTFLHYIDSCLDTIKENSTGTTQNLMILALADTIGGYLKSYLIPVTKEAYYAGNIRYKEISKLYKLYESMKSALETDGKTWAKPINITGTYNARLLVLKPNKHRDMCNNIMMNKEHDVKKSCNGTQGEVFYPIISIPFLDDDDNPQSVAIPVRNSILHNLYSPESAYIVAIHYANIIKCLKLYSVSVKEMYVYNLMFRDWITKHILPRLYDENWYPAFGGILKVLDTTRRLTSGIQLSSHTKVRRGFEILNENEDNKFSKKEETSTRVTFCELGNPTMNDMYYYVHMTTQKSRYSTGCQKGSNEIYPRQDETEGFEIYNRTEKGKSKPVLASSSKEGDEEDAEDEEDDEKRRQYLAIKKKHTTIVHPVIGRSTQQNNTVVITTKLLTETTGKTNTTTITTKNTTAAVGATTAATNITKKTTAAAAADNTTTKRTITATIVNITTAAIKNAAITKNTSTIKNAITASTKNITIAIITTTKKTAAATTAISVKDLYTKKNVKGRPTEEGGDLLGQLSKQKEKQGEVRKKGDEKKKGYQKKKQGKAKGILGQEEEEEEESGEEEGEEEEEETKKVRVEEEHAFSPPLRWFTLCLVLSPYFDLNYLVAHILLILMIWVILFFLNLCSRDFRVRYFLSHEEDRVKITVDYISEKLKRYPDRYYTVGLKACPDRYRRKVYSDHTEGLGPLFTRLLYTYPVQIIYKIKEKTGIGLKDVPSKTEEPIKTLSVRKSDVVEALERDISTIIDISKPDIPYPSPISSSGSTRPGRSTSSSTATRRPKDFSSYSTTGIKRKVPSTEYAPYFSSDQSDTEEEEEDDDEIYAVGEHGTHFTR